MYVLCIYVYSNSSKNPIISVLRDFKKQITTVRTEIKSAVFAISYVFIQNLTHIRIYDKESVTSNNNTKIEEILKEKMIFFEY